MQKAVLYLIKAYKDHVSPALPPSCRFMPTCSTYAYEAISKYGLVKGGYKAVRRILRCHPFSKGGYDPLK